MSRVHAELVRAYADGSAPSVSARGTWPADAAPYRTPRDLCAYVNAIREKARQHDRYKGYPGKGAYHTTRTWPTTFAVDPALVALAQTEADRLARESNPQGSRHADSSWRRPIWIAGLGSEDYQLTAQDQRGDWDPSKNYVSRASLIDANASCRMGLFHQDPGGDGPVLTRMGCGGAIAADGTSRWWVVVLRPCAAR